MDEVEQGGGGEDLTPVERAQLAEQLARLNENLERQFDLIAQQQAAERKASRRRWRIVMVVVLAIIGGNVRVEMVRMEQRQADRDQLEAILRDQCRRTNSARVELRQGFDAAFAAVEDVAPDPGTKDKAREAGEALHRQLAAALPVVDCTDPTRFATVDEFQSCSEARAAGAAPLREGDPGWAPRLDRDGNGIACE